MTFVCRMCGIPWPNPRIKPCACWWGLRISPHTGVRFVCGRCGTPWPAGRKGCACWPNGVRVRDDEIGGQSFPLPGL